MRPAKSTSPNGHDCARARAPPRHRPSRGLVAALAFLLHRAIEKKLKAARIDLSAASLQGRAATIMVIGRVG
jgi:hypothetical protein